MDRRDRRGSLAEGPPQLAQALLRALVRQRDRESVLGDMLEEFRTLAVARGKTRARAEYWREAILSAPHFVRQAIEGASLGRNRKMDTRSGVRQAVLGLLFALPALLLVIGGVLQTAGALTDDLAGSVGGAASGVLRALQHPVFILGGLLLAFLVTARRVLSLGLRRESQALVGSITVRGRLWNLLAVGLALALLGAIAGYAFVENFQVVPTHTAATTQHLTMDEVRAWGRLDSQRMGTEVRPILEIGFLSPEPGQLYLHIDDPRPDNP